MQAVLKVTGRLPFRHVFSVTCLVASAAALSGAGEAVALPLDRQACATLNAEHDRLVRDGVLKTMGNGPEWAAANLKPEGIAQIKQFLNIEAKIRFQCGGDGVAVVKFRVNPKSKTVTVEKPGPVVPLPKRNQRRKPLVAGAVPALIAPRAKPLYAAAAPSLALPLPLRNDLRAQEQEVGGSASSGPGENAQPAPAARRAGPAVPLPLRKPRIVRRAAQETRSRTVRQRKPAKAPKPKFEDQPFAGSN